MQPGPAVGPPRGGMPPSPRPPRRGGVRITLIVSGISIVLIIALVAVIALVSNAVGGHNAGGKDSAIFDADSGFRTDAKLTDDSLAATDSDSIFWTMFKNQATEPLLTIRSKYYLSTADFHEDPLGTSSLGSGVRESRIDYKSQQIAASETDYTTNEKSEPIVDSETRCIDQTEYRLNGGSWEPDPISNACAAGSISINEGDGIAPGGLTPEQADDYINYVQTSHDDNPVSTGAPELVNHDGKEYVKLPVRVTPVNHPETGYSGMQIFVWGMHDINLKPISHLYQDFGTSASGAKLNYYIDPETTLPAYATMQETPPLNADGEQRDDDPADPKQREWDAFQRVQYQFPNQWRPARLAKPNDIEPITLDWDPQVCAAPCAAQAD